MLATYVCIVVQLALVVAFLMGDFGFDKPGGYGLDVGDAGVLLAAYVVALVVGVVVALRRKLWVSLLLQMMVGVCIGYGVLFGLRVLESRYEAADYQYLVGKSKSELQRVIGVPVDLVRSRETRVGEAEVEVWTLRGMDIVLSATGTIIEISGNDQR